MVEIYKLSELLEEPKEEKRITVTEKSFTIDGHYSIDFDECKTHEELLDWVRHLLGKQNTNNYIIRRFMDEVVKVHPELKFY